MFIPLTSDEAPGDRKSVVPWITATLIVANVLVFWLLQDQGRSAWTWSHVMVPQEIIDSSDVVVGPRGLVEITPPLTDPHGQVVLAESAREIRTKTTVAPLGPTPHIYETLITATFMHGSWLHLIGNVVFLWAFGSGLEKLLGPIRFLLFYLVAGALAWLVSCAAAWIFHGLDSPESLRPSLGASGAIAGVMGGFLALLPNRRISIFVALPPILAVVKWPAWLCIGLWGLLQVLQALGVVPGGAGVDLAAHIGGLLVGMVVVGSYLSNPDYVWRTLWGAWVFAAFWPVFRTFFKHP